MKVDRDEYSKKSESVPKPKNDKPIAKSDGSSLKGHKGDSLSRYDKGSVIGGVNPALKGCLPPSKGK